MNFDKNTKRSVPDYSRWFQALTDRLRSTAELWKPRPFVNLPVSWESKYPGISKVLRGLSESQVDDLRGNLPLVREVSPQLREIFDSNQELSGWPELSAQKELLDPKKNPVRVGGRKWRQVERFVSIVAPFARGEFEHWLDWCSGKGHLGHAMTSVSGVRTVFVERDEKLCGDGFVNADVLQDDLSHLFGSDAAVVALHACGNLNAKLLVNAVESECRFLAIAPCCYQRIIGKEYKPLSKAGQNCGLQLGSHHLRLVSFEEVVAGRGEKARRSRDHAFRLGFDLLARETTGEDKYTPLGQLPGDFWKGSFEQFVIKTAELKGIVLPARWDPEFYQRAGQVRWETNRALSLVRSLFARCLESWLLLDRILYLTENGWTVTAGTFCDTKVTPRNLLVIGEKTGDFNNC